MTSGEKSHVIVTDLGFVEEITHVFQNRLLYYFPTAAHKYTETKAAPPNKFIDPHSTSVASISVGSFVDERFNSQSVHGLAEKSKIVSVSTG